MPINLSLLTAEEKNKIEIDKQASYLVWQLKHAKVGFGEIATQRNKFKKPDEQTWFEQSVEKYKHIMGVA
ncbi:DUF3283 family protein [Vibrio sp. MA40-2]|uniref:DUF3283 family protein n=1 Tax=Vibrio sp. MA40-2 TaxID=3391828 RepID=UPI0039A51466